MRRSRVSLSPDLARAGQARKLVAVAFLGAALMSATASAQGSTGPSPSSGDNPLSDIIECLDTPESTRRIEACTAIIDTPGVGANVRGRAHAMRALAHSLRTDYDAAIQDYDEAIKLIPDFSVALNNRAWAFYKSGRPANGLPDVERSIRLDPLSPHSLDTRAHISKALGNPQRALADFRRALTLADKKLITLYQCGLQNQGMYSGKQDGQLSDELFDAMERCVTAPTCDPLPDDEECRPGTS